MSSTDLKIFLSLEKIAVLQNSSQGMNCPHVLHVKLKVKISGQSVGTFGVSKNLLRYPKVKSLVKGLVQLLCVWRNALYVLATENLLSLVE